MIVVVSTVFLVKVEITTMKGMPCVEEDMSSTDKQQEQAMCMDRQELEVADSMKDSMDRQEQQEVADSM